MLGEAVQAEGNGPIWPAKPGITLRAQRHKGRVHERGISGRATRGIAHQSPFDLRHGTRGPDRVTPGKYQPMHLKLDFAAWSD